MPNFCSPDVAFTASAGSLLLSQLLKGWCGKVTDNVSGEQTPYPSHGQIKLTPENPQVVPPGPQKTKVPVLYPFTVSTLRSFIFSYSHSFVKFSAKGLETKVQGQRHCSRSSRREQATFCLINTDEALD